MINWVVCEGCIEKRGRERERKKGGRRERERKDKSPLSLILDEHGAGLLFYRWRYIYISGEYENEIDFKSY